MGVPVNKTILQFSAFIKNSYNKRERDWGKIVSGPRFFDANPDILLLDEPTNNLDPSSREAVANALSGWKGAIIFFSHDTEFVEHLKPTKVLLMPDGQVDYFSHDWLELVSLA